MDATLLSIGGFQPIPFPAPVWLLQVLLVVGFFTHAIPMNVALTGPIVAAILMLLGKNNDEANETKAGKQLAASLPIFVTAAITQGIVPLLFLQVLYGPLVYPSSIAMATPWFSILFLIVLSYYGLYIYNYGSKKMDPKWAPWILILSSVLFMVVGFFFSNNMTLMLTPEKFLPMYQASPAGANLNLGDPTLIPRYLHFVGAAFAVSFLTLGCFGLYKQDKDKEYGNWLLRLGAAGFVGITLVQTVVGLWFLFATPEGFQANVLGGAKMSTHLFNTSIGLEVLALVAMSLAAVKNSAKAYWVGLVSAMLVILSMIGLRHELRTFMTDQYMVPLWEAQPVVPQWPILIIFAVCAAGMIGYFVWLAKTVYRAYNPQ